MISKISLGTVQFGQDYGIANTKGKISREEVFKILDYARYAGIRCLDTASAYGDSESTIGEYLTENPNAFCVVSKLPSMEKFNIEKMKESLKESIDRMQIKQLYGYLLHHFSDIFNSEEIWEGLVSLKADGFTERIGFSLYSPKELDYLLSEKFDFDIVQIPYSIFDRRFEKYFDVLKKKGVEIEARSIFLQGLAFLDVEDLSGSLEAAKPQLEKLRQIADDRKISIEALCLNYVLLNSQIDHVLIGIDSIEQLKKNIVSIELQDAVRDIFELLNEIAIEQEDVLLPTRWSVTK